MAERNCIEESTEVEPEPKNVWNLRAEKPAGVCFDVTS
jgi:hypothetical protein